MKIFTKKDAMSKQLLKKTVRYIIDQGLAAIRENTGETDAVIDYVAFFSKNDAEFNDLKRIAQTLGKEVDVSTVKTGHTFLLNEPFKTSSGLLKLIKIRKPDATRPQRGAPDFKVQNYLQFKNKFLQTNGNFTLMVRKDYEMIEIKGVDVLVYIPNKPLGERMKLSS